MRKLLAIAIIVLTFVVGCSTEVKFESSSSKPSPYRALTAFIGEDTRTYVEEDKYVLWHEDDHLTVFYGDDLNNRYKFDGETGDNGGTFTVVDEGVSNATTTLDRIYAIYPYDAEATIATSGEISYHLPSTQSYAEDSFGVGANTMVATTKEVDDTELFFSNLCGYLKIKLYGNILVKSIELRGNGGEKIAGLATITATNDAPPTLYMSEEADESIVLDCGDGIAVGSKADRATTFWLVVPPTTFADGITITVTSTSDEVFEKSTQKPVVIARNTIQPMAAFEVVGERDEVENIADIIDPIFDSCSSMEEFVSYGEQLKGMYGVADVDSDGETLWAVLDNGFVMAWSFAEWSTPEEGDVSAVYQEAMDYVATRSSTEHNYIGGGDTRKLKVGIFNQRSSDSASYAQDMLKNFDILAFKYEKAGFDVDIKKCEDLTYEFYANEFFDYDIIIWHTHGCTMGQSMNWFLGAPYNGEWLEDADKVRDTPCKGRVRSKDLGGAYQVVSPYYFKESDKKFENEALIFAAVCGTIKDQEQNVYNVAFKNKNVVTYLGYDRTTFFSGYAAYDIFEYMLEGMTIGEAYDKGKWIDWANLILLGDDSSCIVHPTVKTSYPAIEGGMVTMSGEVDGWNEYIIGDIGFVWTTHSAYESPEYELTVENGEGKAVVYEETDAKTERTFTFTTTEPQPNAQSPFTSGQLYMCRAYAKVHDEYIYGETRPFVVDGGNNIIYYETTDENITGPTAGEKVGNAKVLSNTYDGGVGVIVCDADITYLAREFNRDERLKSIVLPDSIAAIGAEAFYQCYALEMLSLPSTLISIGYDCFLDCRGLTELYIPDSVTSIDRFAFCGCNQLTKVKLSNSLTAIKVYTFAHCSALQSVEIPDSVTTIGDNAFYNCSSIQRLELPDSVTSLGSNVFTGCTGIEYLRWGCGIKTLPTGCNQFKKLKDVVVSEGVTSIAASALRDCPALENVQLPTTLTLIGDYAFNDCVSLKNITIPDSVTSIGQYAFCGCNQLSELKLSNSLTAINKYTFAHCAALQSVEIPDSVTTIGNNAFYNCSSIQRLELPDSVTSLGSNVFTGCTGIEYLRWGCGIKTLPTGCNQFKKLKEVVVSEGVTSIAASALRDCPALENVQLPTTLTSIGDYAFNDCVSLKNITIPDSVTSIGQYAFCGCNQLSELKLSNGLTTINQYTFAHCKSLQSIDIPNSVTKLGQYCFGYCSNLTTAKIGSGVITLENDVFRENSSLESVELGGNVTSLGGGAFNGCISLKYINIPNSVTTIANRVFGNCSSLENIEIPNGVITIGDNVFNGCTSLKSITIPDSVTSLGSNVFTGCTGIEYLRLGSGIKNVQANIFKDNKSLKEVVFGEGVTSIGDCAFRACNALEKLSLPSTLISIGYDCFLECRGLTELYIPDSVTSIGQYAFCGCDQLTKVKLSNSLTTINMCTFANCAALQSIEIPDSVTSIGECAFAECTSLTDFNISSNITHIGGAAFRNCSGPRVITIPASVVTLRSHAFEYPNLEEVHCKPIDIPTGCASAFGSRNITVYVPKESYSKYRNIYSWRYYTIIGE